MAQCSDEARMFLEELLCLDLSTDTEERTFTPREGMRTVFTGIFTDVNSVKVNGVEVTNYYKAFFDKRNGQFFNSIVFDCAPNCEVVVDADWGFNTIPADLKRLLANADKLISQSYTVKDIKSKQVEDFRVTYGDLSDDEVFLKQNAVTINKYSMCNIPYVLSGGCKWNLL